jgi:hypothetical protein
MAEDAREQVRAMRHKTGAFTQTQTFESDAVDEIVAQLRKEKNAR